MIGSFGLKLYALGAAALAVVLILFTAYRAGGKAANAAIVARAYSRLKTDLREKREIQDEVGNLSDADAVSRLRENWTRGS